jgi:hypothetical protein
LAGRAGSIRGGEGIGELAGKTSFRVALLEGTGSRRHVAGRSRRRVVGSTRRLLASDDSPTTAAGSKELWERERKGNPSSNIMLGQMNQPGVFQGAQGQMYINVTLHRSPSTKRNYTTYVSLTLNTKHGVKCINGDLKTPMFRLKS